MKSAYVSSTFRDLEDHRSRVREALRRLNFLDVAMEHYGADERRPVDRCVQDVSNSNLYIGIVAFRRGYVPEEDNPDELSITEMEYEAAKAHDVNTLVFLLHEDAPWPRSLMDEGMSAVDAFRERVSTETSVDWFHTPDDLVAKVTQAVTDWERRHSSAPSAAEAATKAADLSTYRAALERRYGILDLDVLAPPETGDPPPIRLRSVFIEPTFQSGLLNIPLPAAVRRRMAQEGNSEPLRVDRPRRPLVPDAPAFSVLSSRHRHVVLGQPGSGKSTLIRHLALGLTAEDPTLTEAFGARTPFVIELRHYAPQYQSGAIDSPLAFLYRLSSAEGWGLDPEHVDLALQHDALVLFDGLDEVFDRALQTDVTRQIIAFADRHPSARVVVTSRLVGYRPRPLEDAGFVPSSIAPLDQPQVEAFLSRWYTEAGLPAEKADALQTRLLDAYDSLPSIRQLAGSPLLLTLLALINRHRELPRERARLYEHAAQVLVHHWDLSKEIAPSPIAHDLDEHDKLEMLQRLALDMQSGVEGLAGNYVRGDDLVASFADYIQDRYKADLLQATDLAKRLVDRFRSRNYVLVLYGAELYGFVHRALLEYFAALAVRGQFEKSRQIDADQLTALVLDRAGVPAWREVLLLLLALLDASVTKSLVAALLAEPLPNTLYDEPHALSLALAALADARERGIHATNAERALSLAGERLEQALSDPPWIWSVSPGRSDPLFQSVADVASRWPRPDLAIDWLSRNATTVWPEPRTPLFGEPFDSLHATAGLYLNRITGGLGAVADGDEHHVQLLVGVGLLFRVYINHESPSHRAVGMWGWAFHPLSLNPHDNLIQAGALPVIGVLHHDASEAVRWHAAGSLLALSVRTQTSYAEALQHAAQTDESADVRAAALSAFTASEVYLAASSDALSEHLSFVERFLEDEAPRVRIAAVNALLSLPFDPERFEDQALRLLKSDPDTTVRWRAAVLFGKEFVGRPGTWNVITSDALSDSDKRVREEAVGILTTSLLDHDGSQYVVLNTLKSDPAASVRARALRAVLETPAPFEPLSDLLFDIARSDRSADVRGTALSALLGRRVEADEDLLLLLYHTLREDSNGDNRLRAAREIIKRDPKRGRIVRALEKNIEHDRSKRVRTELASLRDSLDA